MKKNDLKIYALYLPAYHRIKENDKWWGDGFTEWDNVKRGKPLFKNHFQPNIPLNNNYYDLSKVETIKKQAELAKKYGVDGFIFYHYWFSGKMLLEKPAELLLSNKDINTNYAFCWANEPWTRTWDGKNTDILMPQKYGFEEDWENHIKYLSSFFEDQRYIKIDGHPLLFIYSPCNIPRFDDMINYWNNYLKENGQSTIYLAEYICPKNPTAFSKYSSAVMEFEPLYSYRYSINIFKKFKRFIFKKMKKLEIDNYDKHWKRILKNNKTYGNRVIFKGCFCSWDNTPRKGNIGLVFKNSSPLKFKRYLKALVESKRKKSVNTVIINAWNEWGEGAILEPTEKDNYEYLEAIKSIVDEYKK